MAMVHSAFVLMFMLVLLPPGTLSRRRHQPRDERKCKDCVNCCNNNNQKKEGDGGCVSSDMKVEELKKGIVSVSELSPGDIIRGLRGPAKTQDWCRVDAVDPREGLKNVSTYNGFTDNHMVIDDDTVRPYGQKGEAIGAQLYTLATDCDAALNADGQGFTPLSTTFCPHELTWSEYLVLMAAIRRVTSRTGYFWYLSDAFHDNKTAKVQRWVDVLPDMCTEMLKCAGERECQKFEKIIEELVHEHLNKKYALVVERVFPNLGGDVNKDESGTLSQAVRQDDETNIILISTLSFMACMLIVIAVLLYFLLRVLRKRSMKQPQPKSSVDNMLKGTNKYQKV